MTVTSIQNYWAMDRAVAQSNAYPVRLEVMLNHHDAEHGLLFVEDAQGASFTYAPSNLVAKPGQHIVLLGVTESGPMRPTNAIVLDRFGPREARQIEMDELFRWESNARYVETEGVVRSGMVNGERMQLSLSSGRHDFAVLIKNRKGRFPAEFLNKIVTVRGTVSYNYGPNGPTGMDLRVNEVGEIVAVRPDTDDLPPMTTLDTWLESTNRPALGPLVHVEGRLIQDSNAWFIDDGTGRVRLRGFVSLDYFHGDRLDLTGFLDWTNGLPQITRTRVREVKSPVGTTVSAVLPMDRVAPDIAAIRRLTPADAPPALGVDLSAVVTHVAPTQAAKRGCA